MGSLAGVGVGLVRSECCNGRVSLARCQLPWILRGGSARSLACKVDRRLACLVVLLPSNRPRIPASNTAMATSDETSTVMHATVMAVKVGCSSSQTGEWCL